MQSQVMTPMQWTLLGLLSLLWGGSFVGAEVALRELAPFSVVFARVALAALALLLVVRWRGLSMPRGIAGWAPFLVMGLLNNVVPFSLIVWGQTRIGAGLAAVLNATTPLFAVLLAHALGQEHLSVRRVLAVAGGVAGVAVLVGPSALAGLDAETGAQLAVLGAALSYAFAGVFGRRFRSQPVLVTATGQVTASSLLLLPVVLLVEPPWQQAMPGAATLFALLALGLLSTAVAYLLYFHLLATAGATNLLLVTLLIPVSAMAMAALLLGEAVGARQLLGMSLIGLALLLLDGRVLGWFRARVAN